MLDNHEISKGAPGVLGAISAMLWLRETGLRRVASVLIGSAASYYGTPFGLKIFETLDHSLMGYLIGLFAMAITAKIFELLDSFPVKELTERIFKRLGI